MKSLRITFLLLCNLFFYSICSAQWIKIVTPYSSGYGMAIDACDSLTAIFSAHHFLVLTNDQGKTWKELQWPNKNSNNLPYYDVIDVSMIDSLHIWCGVDDGRIIATSDGGKTWNEQYFDVSVTGFIDYIKMFDSNNGIAMGDAASENRPPAILKTTNGGANWVAVISDTIQGGVSGDTWRRIDFTSMNVGYFIRSMSPYRPQLYKTTDGGNHWNVASSHSPLIVKVYGDNICLLGASGSVYRTLDGGNTWGEFMYANNTWESAIEFIPGDPSKIWLSEIGHVYFSADTGKTWKAVLSGAQFRDIKFTDNNHGWLLADTGVVYRTSNNGNMITEVNDSKQNFIPCLFELYQNYPNPFNPTTIISYTIPASLNPSKGGTSVVLKIYDVLGREITTLVNEQKSSGTYEVKFNGTGLSSGIYFYRLTAGDYIQTKKMVVLK
jgi:photosystem II stability/assembly factor-like uncharacterized protein